MQDTGNIRRHIRFDLNSKARVMWTDRFGRDKWASVRLFDASESGVRMELPEAVELRSVLNFMSENANVRGQATVRFCRREGNKFLVGAEFVGDTFWKGPG
jgi:hypothetical protein